MIIMDLMAKYEVSNKDTVEQAKQKIQEQILNFVPFGLSMNEIETYLDEIKDNCMLYLTLNGHIPYE